MLRKLFAGPISEKKTKNCLFLSPLSYAPKIFSAPNIHSKKHKRHLLQSCYSNKSMRIEKFNVYNLWQSFMPGAHRVPIYALKLLCFQVAM